MSLRFEDPPPRRRKGSVTRGREIDLEVEELRTNPGAWAIVVELDAGGNGIAYVRAKAYKKRGCEIRVVSDQLHHKVYARWPAEETIAS